MEFAIGRKPLEFAIGKHVSLRVEPTKYIRKAIKSRKLTPKFIEPYQILRRVKQITNTYKIVPPINLNINLFYFIYFCHI